MQIPFHHFAPLSLHLLVGLRVAIARQIHEIQLIVHIIVIDGLGLARLGTGAGQRLTVHQGIDQRGLAHIALARKRHLGQAVLRQLAGDAAHPFQTDILYHHTACLLSPLLYLPAKHYPRFPSQPSLYMAASSLFLCSFLCQTTGSLPFSTVSLVIQHSSMVSSEGMWYMVSIRMLSRMERRPLAPVLRSKAFSAMAITASSSKDSSTPSMPKSFLYCLISAFFGSFRIRTKASLSSPLRLTQIGTRPTNSGISPNFTRSGGVTSCSSSPRSFSDFWVISALKPIDLRSSLASMIFSSPSNAPPQTKRILEVSMEISS